MDERICSFPECGDPVGTRGLCAGHYSQQQRGTPLRPIRRGLTAEDKRALVVERFWSRVDKSGPPFKDLGNCWLWTGALEPQGYGKVGVGPRKRGWAHRLSFEIHFGATPEGLVLDHICGIRRCVNPAHLRAVTIKQNCEHRTRMYTRNTSGYRGVAWNKRMGKWTAQVQSGERKYHLGYFSSAEEAAKVAADKRAELFTHDDF